MRAILSNLVDHAEPLLDYFDGTRTPDHETETARLLFETIEPHTGDEAPVKLRRWLIFQRLWEASQHGDHRFYRQQSQIPGSPTEVMSGPVSE